MSIENGAVRIFSGWGRNALTTNSQWKDAWTYICAALDGTWGRQTFGEATAFNTGYQTHWSTKIFTATSTSFSLTIPVQSFESYVVQIINLTTGITSVAKILAGVSTFSCTLVIGYEYQIVSTEFLLKTK